MEALRYSDAELEEFKAIIEKKLAQARSEYDYWKGMAQAPGADSNEGSPTFKSIEEGDGNQSRIEAARLADRQRKFIEHLEAAMVRIDNKTYGIDRNTGLLIPKERLRAVPHATLSIDQKQARK